MTNREASIILAALRLLQEELEDGGIAAIHFRLPHFADFTEDVTLEEIDNLCERINFSPDGAEFLP